jgi:parallel beta-helix repeat protein
MTAEGTATTQTSPQAKSLLLESDLATKAGNIPSHSDDYGLMSESPRQSELPVMKIQGDSISITYHFPSPQVCTVRLLNDSSHVSVRIDGCFQFGDNGNPVLPVRTARIAIPSGKEVKSLDVVGERKIVLPGAHLVEYGTECLPLSVIESSSSNVSDFPNRTVYDSMEPFPGKMHSEFSIQHKMGYDIALLNLFPLQYLPKAGELSYYGSIRVEVQTANVKETGRSRPVLNPLQYETLRSAVDNPDVVEYSFTLETTSAYKYVIITNEELSDTPGPYNLQALRDNKITRGISTEIVTVEWIYANYNGTRPDGREDNQTKIRNFIIDAYRNGTAYVLLAGDGDGGDAGGESGDCIIPHRGFYVEAGTYTDYDIPADMYYGCLDGTFDYDGDGIYGEPNDGPGGGEVDLFAEVYVGRACVDSYADVQNFVRKTLTYQTTSNTSDLKKVWMVGERLGFGGVAEWGGNYKDEIKDGSSAHGYNTTGFMDSPYSDMLAMSTLYDRDYPGNNWPKSDIINVINSNVNLINHLGHANVNYVMKMYNPDVDSSLTNDGLYFIGYSQGCYSGSFDDRTTSGTYANYDCIGEHLTNGAHGAAAFIANSRYGWGERDSTDGPSQHFDRQFWDAVLGENILNIGMANQDSKEDNAGLVATNNIDRWCCYEINLLGDPELKVRLPSEEHQLDVGLESPVYMDLGESVLLNATVHNRGLENESQVELFLMIDGVVVHNETISKLSRGSNYTMSFPWTPPREAVFNVTAYAPPVQGEYDTTDNTEMVSVLVNAQSLLVVNDNDGSAYVNGTSLSAFALALNDTGYSFLVWNESSMGNPPLGILSKFKLVIWTCGDYWSEAVSGSDAQTLESYVAQGGNLLIEGEDIGFDHHADGFMVNVAHAIYQVDKTGTTGLAVTKPNHPVTSGLSSNFTWATSPNYDDGVTPANTGMEVIRYAGTNWTAVTIFEGTISKVAYYAFPLYCLRNPEQKTLALNSVNWLLSSPRRLGWLEKGAVCEESFSVSELNPSIATDSNGYLYAAYEHYNNISGFYGICVSKSMDRGNTWSRIYTLSWSNNLQYPSIAIDVGDNNNIFVAFEREWTTTDHDIFVLRYAGGNWALSAVANVLGSDDRYPSIASEYQYGTADRQYISYEYVYSYDDRDVMFAKSIDDGATWSLQKLHGNWPDGNVHCQTSITTTRGSDGNDMIYIAYKWGADYNSAYDIVVDKSKDRGATWTQQWVCDESSRNKNWPSTISTRGGGAVVIAWHVYYDSAYLNDIQYVYSVDNGNLWSQGWLALDWGVDERNPVLTVDGQDSTSPYTSGSIRAAYWRDSAIYYRQADFSSLWSWSAAERVTNTSTYVSSIYTKPAITVYRSVNGRYLPAVAWTNLCSSGYDVCYSTKEVLPIYAETLRVPEDYSTIQGAINVAYDGDTVLVFSGTYYENVVIHKAVSLIGDNKDLTIIDGNFTGNVVNITACNVNVNGFTIRRSGTTMLNGKYGIYVSETSSGSNVSGNTIISNFVGICLAGLSSNNTIINNELSNNNYGLWFETSTSNVVYHNNFIDNAVQAYLAIEDANILDDGYPSGGNYWSDYAGVDLYSGSYQNETGSDKIGDTPYYVSTGSQDRYPLMNPYGNTTVSLDPVQMSVGFGQIFAVDVHISDVVDLYAYEFKLTWNYSIVELQSAFRPSGHFLEPTDPMNQFVPVWKINETRVGGLQTAHFGYSLLAPETGRTGSGVLVRLTFKALSLGSALLTLGDTKLANTVPTAILHTHLNSHVTVGPAIVSLIPSEILANAGQTFTVDVFVSNVADLYAYEFKLTWNYSIVELQSAFRPSGHFLEPVLDPSNYFVPVWKINETRVDGLQTAHFGYTLLAPETGRTGGGILVRLTFKALAAGSSSLTPNNVNLANTASAPLPNVRLSSDVVVAIAIVSLQPSEMLVNLGKNFGVDVYISDVVDLYAYEFKLTWNYSIVELQSAFRPSGHFLEPTDPMNQFVPVWKINETRVGGLQTAHFGYSLLAPENGRAGGGIVVRLTFRTLTQGVAALTLSDVKLADSVPAPLPSTALSGNVTVALATVSLTPSETHLELNQTFTVDLNISNVVNLYSYEVKIWYRHAVLNATDASLPAAHFLEPQIDPSYRFIPKWEIKNDYNATHGRIWLSFTLLAPELGRTGSGILAQITFNCISSGSTNIILNDYPGTAGPVRLVCPDLTSVPHEVTNTMIHVLSPGDINKDCVVDIFDVTIVALAFSSTPSDPNWNPVADINNDGIVDIFDIVVVALHFGETG